MSVLSEMIQERKEWPHKQKLDLERHQNLMMFGEFAMFLEITLLFIFYREIVIACFSRYIGW